MSSFAKADPTQRPLGDSGYIKTYPTSPIATSTTRSEDEDRQYAFYQVGDEVYKDVYEEVEEGEEYEMIDDEGIVGSDTDMVAELGIEAEEQDADMADISSLRSSGQDSSEMPSSTQRRKRRASPDSPSAVAGGDGPSSVVMDTYNFEDQAGSRLNKGPGGVLKKEIKGGLTATTCANCRTTSTPLWRRAVDGQSICNAC
ncbi:hypothetical protein BGZ65_012326, partial [Modicella reniformis]